MVVLPNVSQVLTGILAVTVKLSHPAIVKMRNTSCKSMLLDTSTIEFRLGNVHVIK